MSTPDDLQALLGIILIALALPVAMGIAALKEMNSSREDF